MNDSLGITPSRREISRQERHDASIKLMMPAFVVMMLPLAVGIVASIATGKDKLSPAFRYLDPHMHSVVGLMALLIIPLLRALYLTIWLDMQEAMRQDRTDAIMRKFAPTYAYRMPRGEKIAWTIFYVVFFGLVGFMGYVLVFGL